MIIAVTAIGDAVVTPLIDLFPKLNLSINTGIQIFLSTRREAVEEALEQRFNNITHNIQQINQRLEDQEKRISETATERQLQRTKTDLMDHITKVINTLHERRTPNQKDNNKSEQMEIVE